MAADMHIHVFREGELTEEDFREFKGGTLGSKWFDMTGRCGQGDSWMAAYDKFASTDSVWVGEVSWLKAAFFDDYERYIPDPISAIYDAIGEDWPVVDDDLIAKIDAAMREENSTQYMLAGAEEILTFLEEHRGWMAFTVSW